VLDPTHQFQVAYILIEPNGMVVRQSNKHVFDIVIGTWFNFFAVYIHTHEVFESVDSLLVFLQVELECPEITFKYILVHVGWIYWF